MLCRRRISPITLTRDPPDHPYDTPANPSPSSLPSYRTELFEWRSNKENKGVSKRYLRTRESSFYPTDTVVLPTTALPTACLSTIWTWIFVVGFSPLPLRQAGSHFCMPLQPPPVRQLVREETPPTTRSWDAQTPSGTTHQIIRTRLHCT